MIDVGPARTVLQWAIDDRVFPAAAVEAGTMAGAVWRDALGTLTYDERSARATVSTVFDLASLTKVIATGTVAMRLVESGAITLDDPVAMWVGQWQGADRASVTIRDLLSHASGLPAWRDLYRTCRGASAYVEAICRMPLEYTPRTASVYSDLGFILLGHLLELAGDAPLDQLHHAAASADVGDPLAVPRYLPPPSWASGAAPCRAADDRGAIGPGEVDDTNAWAMGGVAGHAGLFGTAPAVGAFARAVLRTSCGLADSTWRLGDRALLRQFVEPSPVPGSSRALAWDTMRPTSSCGTRLSARAFGHTGFTGTSLWIDPALDLYVVLLTNRVHPQAVGNEGIQSVRRAFHDALAEAVLAGR
jgi:CubicO group peptidase (beta-lactamase class C family)